ncbi:hypothetical protein BUALT_Bualt19G0128100 [Buddleja alternifolia]|uniref:Uncharacterized protein n=1 Tax=Buddleja alternifolia TaxID=168488 RepID=A0AAV6W2Z3_9LAMI|nr:hypothetical protein BUALT_Bualt19G0128100 [Buddleja alternifolia]
MGSCRHQHCGGDRAVPRWRCGCARAAVDADEDCTVRKKDLKQVLGAIRDGRSGACRGATAAATSLEQRLNFMRRRHILRAASQVKCRSWGAWRPVLQSIPEEY